MNWLAPSIIATLAASVILTLVYVILYFKERRVALGLWSLAWIMACFRYLTELVLLDHRGDGLFSLCSNLFSLLTALFLIWGSCSWANRRFWKGWILGTILCGLWIIGSLAFRVNPLWAAWPTFFFTGAAFLITGILFLYTPHITGVAVGAAGTTVAGGL